MALLPRTPWRPDRSWADPLIAALALVSALFILLGTQARSRSQQRPPDRVSQTARLQDLTTGIQRLFPHPLPGFPRKTTPPIQPWDRALEAIRLAEEGKRDEAQRVALEGPEPAGPAGRGFRPAWRWAYLGEGTAPTPSERQALSKALGSGWSAHSLEIRLEERAGRDSAPLRRAAEQRMQRQLVGLLAFGIGGLLAALAGLGFALYLWIAPKRVTPPAPMNMSGRALLLVLLLWFVGSQLASIPALVLIQLLPGARPLALPLQYLLHASLGLFLFAFAEGLTLRALFRHCFPRPARFALLQGLGFFATATAAVFLVAMAVGPFLPKDVQPQKELMELIGGAWGAPSVVLLFLTVAGLAPLFEEVLFRGALLGWLQARLADRRWGPGVALVLSGLAFGAIHLQPAALPTLGTLGIVLGWAALRTRSLWASVLVHALWNGSVFALTRLLA